MQRSVVIFNFYQQIAETISERIAGEADDFIMGTSVEDLVEYYFDQYHHTPIELDPEKAITSEIKKVKRVIPAHQREWPFQSAGDLKAEFEYISITLPILPHPQLTVVKSLEPSRHDSGFFGEELHWTTDSIAFDILIRGYGTNKTEDAVAKEVEQSVQWVRNKLSYIASDLEIQNRELKVKIAQFANNQNRKVAEDRERYASLMKKIDIPVRLKEDAPTNKVRLNPKPLVRRVRPTPQQPVEYTLDENKVLDIISVLDNQGRQFEKTPATYQKLEEEELRNILLVNLNSLFEGAATGETFCANGKTDIYLQLSKGNILSFECKFWSGRRNYQETIDQLLGYLTWRMNYGIIILFSKQKNFTNVLHEGQTAIQEHPSYSGSFQQIKSGHFRSYHALPTDEDKHVQLHHLFYTITTS